MKRLAALAGIVLLAGCAGQDRAPSEDEGWVRWVCDSQSEIFWRFASADRNVIEVRLEGRDDLYRLYQEPVGAGALYSDGMLAFQTQGDQGLVYWVTNDALVGRGCEAP